MSIKIVREGFSVCKLLSNDIRERAWPVVLFKINIDIYKQTNINPSKCPKSTRIVSQNKQQSSSVIRAAVHSLTFDCLITNRALCLCR